MATFIEYLNNKKMGIDPRRPVVLVSGRNEFLRLAAMVDIEGRWESTRVETCETIAQLLFTVSGSAIERRATAVLENIEGIPDLEIRLKPYIEHPGEEWQIVLTASETKNREKERWIPSSKKGSDPVLYIDCGILDEDQLRSLACTRGLSEEDAAWLVEATSADAQEIFQTIDRASYVKPQRPGLIQEILPVPQRTSIPLLKELSVYDSGSPSRLYSNLQKRMGQLAILAEITSKTKERFSGEQLRDIGRKIDAEVYMVLRLLAIARGTKPEVWLSKLARLAEVDRYVNEPGFREYVACVVR